jgi:hypothetical protein
VASDNKPELLEHSLKSLEALQATFKLHSELLKGNFSVIASKPKAPQSGSPIEQRPGAIHASYFIKPEEKPYPKEAEPTSPTDPNNMKWDTSATSGPVQSDFFGF